jgi:hypothetical protein
VFKTHALLDTVSGSSYASAKLISALKKKPNNVKTRRIETMLGSTTTKVETYTAKLSSAVGKFVKEIELSKVHKSEIMMFKKPNYESLLARYKHLNGIKIADGDDREQIPIHVVLSMQQSKRQRLEELDPLGSLWPRKHNWGGQLCRQAKRIKRVECL